jgi:hypothetical protein
MKIFRNLNSILPIFGVLIVICCISCQKDCTETFVWNEYQPIWVGEDSIHVPIQTEAPREIQKPGKIYWYPPYLLINEKEEGLHIIDNSDPSNPTAISFLKVKGNRDMAVLNNILYADSYFDLISIDISDVHNITETHRVEMFRAPDYYDPSLQSFIVDYEIIPHEEEVPCGQNSWFGGGRDIDIALDQAAGNNAESNGNAGTGGSLARFTIAQEHLYIVDEYGMMIFDLSKLNEPEFTNRVDLGWGIETIFPYVDNLFIGANNGMHILDASDPSNPQYLSTFAHANACDPVFVRNGLAYITLRDGTECETYTNQLDIVDIEDLTNPKLLVSHPMDNPHGLFVTDENLFLCEGEFGFKVFDSRDIYDISKKLLDQIPNLHSYDVIALNSKLLMVIGDDGFYQFALNQNDKLEELSRLAVYN